MFDHLYFPFDTGIALRSFVKPVYRATLLLSGIAVVLGAFHFGRDNTWFMQMFVPGSVYVIVAVAVCLERRVELAAAKSVRSRWEFIFLVTPWVELAGPFRDVAVVCSRAKRGDTFILRLRGHGEEELDLSRHRSAADAQSRATVIAHILNLNVTEDSE